MRKGVPFTVSIVTLMLCIVGLLSAALLFVGWRSAHTLEEANIDLHMAALDEAVSDWLDGTVRGAVYAQEAMARSPIFRADVEHADEDELVGELVWLLRYHAEVDASYVGYADGRFLYVGQVQHADELLSGDAVVPPDADLLVRLVQPAGTGAVETYFFIMSDGSHGARQTRPSTFDPRTRPWYREALEAHGPIMTEPYVFAFSGAAGVTVATPIGLRTGAIGFDYTLEDLSRVAARHKVSQSAIVMVATAAGNLLADSTACAGCAHASPQVVEFLRSELIVATHGGAGRTDVRHAAARHDWEMLIDPMPPVLAERFFVATAAPVEEIAGESRHLIGETVVVALAAVLLAVASVLAAALVLSIGMRRVAARTGRIRDLDFTGGQPVRSRIREIILLSDAVERMREALEVFGRYVAKDLVRQIMRSPTAAGVGGERREVTVMFTDIEGFSRISEGIAPELLTGRLSRYFDALALPIAAQRGTIDKFIGDSIMAFWNAPEPDERHVEHACRAALQAAAASRQLAGKWSGRGRPIFRTRFGLHTGPAVIGNVGARDRINYTLVGAVANQASRLEGLNKVYGTAILASGEVVERTAGSFVWRHVDRAIPAGTSEVIELYELLGTSDDAFDARFLEQWNQARGLYVAGDFARAAAAFEAAARLAPDDDACRVMRERCGGFLRTPPQEWDGTWRFDVK